MVTMDFISDTRHRDKSRESPYVEISSSDTCDFESVSSSPRNRTGSINSFLEEAEIVTPASEEIYRISSHEMRRKLNDYFMNPIQKWRIRGRFPWKLSINLINIIIATIQMCLFGFHSFEYVRQHLDMKMTLSHIFLKDWTADVAVYPPGTGPYALYTIPEFYEHVDNVIQQYGHINSTAIGIFGYDTHNGVPLPLEFCVSQYKGRVYPGNSTIEIHDLPRETCFSINPSSFDTFSTESFLIHSNYSINFKTLVFVKLHLQLKTLFLKSANKLDFPECYKLKIVVLYDNREHDGQMEISMPINSNKVLCHVRSRVGDKKEDLYYLLRQLLNSFVIIFSILSGILCLRSLHSGYKLARQTVLFFRHFYNKEVPFGELLDFVDLWYINIAISDIMLVFGSLIKMQIEEESAEGSEYAKCSILLGVGNLLIWIGILRYLGFFDKYNMLILTLKKALPNVLRFLICAVFLFLGYTFCGWIVLGPYHIKFRTLSRTAECLFAIMNGDDMFATFALLDTKLDVIWWFARFYLYSFLLIFIYVVVSLFISVIMDTYETIKHLYSHGAEPKKIVEIFLAAEAQEPSAPSDVDRDDGTNSIKKMWHWVRLHSWLK
ncbi:mucolipin-3-like [Parasteatoda tepidariorum]|uniref:mucolipin-3-like n=1 Tax=Parasteatoda tepidariorum TaxID=114398 RepID=UPI00077FA72A|nr:mucolipin-3-like [Parasteatoda tepidariorum]